MSPALELARMWLTGQMPQTRDMSPAFPRTDGLRTVFSKPRNSVTWNRADSTSPASFELNRNLGVAFDAGHRLESRCGCS